MDAVMDQIYEAAFLPELWPNVLAQLAERSRSAAGDLLILNQNAKARFVATDLILPVMEDIDRANGFAAIEVTLQLLARLPPSTFCYDADYFPAEALAANHERLNRTRPLGIGGQLGTFMALPTGEVLIFAMERWLASDRPEPEEIAVMNLARPHLARAGLVAARLELKQAQTMVTTLDRLGLPAAVLRPGGNVLAVNAQFEALDTLFIARAFGGVSVADRNANILLQTAVEGMQKRDRSPIVASIPIASQLGLPTHVIHIVPLRRSARDIFASADLLLVVTRVGAATGIPSNALVMALFDLSPAEARLSLRLARGVSLAEAARDCELSIASARTYLARIFSKTGTHSQHQLVALLRSAGSLGPTSDTEDFS